MTEHDFLDALSHRREYYAFAKEAAAGDVLKTLAANPVAAGAAIGALAGVGLQYMANRPGKSGKSLQRRAFERSARVAKSDVAQAKKEGRKPSFSEETRATTAPALARLSEAAEKHPLRAALPALVPGAAAGASFARALK